MEPATGNSSQRGAPRRLAWGLAVCPLALAVAMLLLPMIPSFDLGTGAVR